MVVKARAGCFRYSCLFLASSVATAGGFRRAGGFHCPVPVWVFGSRGALLLLLLLPLLCLHFARRARGAAPCRGFCQHVRDRCEPVFSRYQGVSWPEFLNCSAFPEIAENGPCFTPPDPSEVTVPPIVFSFDVILPTLVVEPPTTPQATPTAVATTTQTLTPTPPPACQRVDTKYCPSAIGYTDTRFPTSRGQQTQLQAETELASYETLIRTECSGAIVHFLCSYFFPECVNGVVLEPCRELCLHVRPGCRAAVQQLNSTWPAEFACESLPSRTGGSCSGPANPAAVSVPVIPGVTDRGDATVPLTLTTLLLVCLAAVYCGGF